MWSHHVACDDSSKPREASNVRGLYQSMTRDVCLQHQTEMELLLKYSPFKTEAQFMKEFDKIESNSGSLVIVYNLKLLDSGQPELDVKTDHHDIILTNPSGSTDNDGSVTNTYLFNVFEY